MAWQPMPAKAWLPSGTRVLVLRGQPEQKNALRERVGASLPASRSNCSTRETRASNSLTSPNCFKRATIARATYGGLNHVVTR